MSPPVSVWCLVLSLCVCAAYGAVHHSPSQASSTQLSPTDPGGSSLPSNGGKTAVNVVVNHNGVSVNGKHTSGDGDDGDGDGGQQRAKAAEAAADHEKVVEAKRELDEAARELSVLRKHHRDRVKQQQRAARQDGHREALLELELDSQSPSVRGDKALTNDVMKKVEEANKSLKEVEKHAKANGDTQTQQEVTKLQDQVKAEKEEVQQEKKDLNQESTAASQKEAHSTPQDDPDKCLGTMAQTKDGTVGLKQISTYAPNCAWFSHVWRGYSLDERTAFCEKAAPQAGGVRRLCRPETRPFRLCAAFCIPKPEMYEKKQAENELCLNNYVQTSFGRLSTYEQSAPECAMFAKKFRWPVFKKERDAACKAVGAKLGTEKLCAKKSLRKKCPDCKQDTKAVPQNDSQKGDSTKKDGASKKGQDDDAESKKPGTSP